MVSFSISAHPPGQLQEITADLLPAVIDQREGSFINDLCKVVFVRLRNGKCSFFVAGRELESRCASVQERRCAAFTGVLLEEVIRKGFVVRKDVCLNYPESVTD